MDANLLIAMWLVHNDKLRKEELVGMLIKRGRKPAEAWVSVSRYFNEHSL
jgi:hypothetical protein